MTDDIEMLIIGEDGLDDFFNKFMSETPPHNLVPGCNIKTGCYGLFLCALDECNNETHTQILNEAITAIFNIKGCSIFGALAIHYPPESISYDITLKLAEAIIVINNTIGSKHAEHVTEATWITIDYQITQILGLTPQMIEIMEKENAKCPALRSS